MLKHKITYTNFNDEEVTEDLYFNLAKNELVKMEVGGEDGSLRASIEKIMAAEDKLRLVEEFEKIILGAYGIKSEDGTRFIKTKQLREEFAQSAAYDALFGELITNETTVANFIIGIMPKDMAAMIDKMNPQDKPMGLPPQPPVPPGPKPV